MAETIRGLFSSHRPIDRAIEKVIDYYAQAEDRLAVEIDEYEITDNVEACFRKFLETYDEGVRGGQVTEVGIWVSGFYGSGKSSFTKYLGFALDPNRSVQGKPFIDLLCDRFRTKTVPATLRTVAKKHPTAIVLLDLGAEQLAESAATPVSTVLYWKVLQWAGFSKEKKLAQLEFTLERRNKLEEFNQAYQARYKEDWDRIHNDPLLGVARAAGIVPQILSDEFPTPESFFTLRFEQARDVRDLAREMIELSRRRTKCDNILFLIDEAGQYVAPRGELILNMDGLARNLKELGQGKVWIAATGQQTLTEIVEKAAHNSAELNKLKDRFPISIHLDASDIREITYRRLLTKSPEAEKALKALFQTDGQALCTHTRLTGTSLYKGDPDATSFARLYPFLPQHFDLLLELIRTLARSTGGIGLRSAIRVIQDVLVDKSRVLPASATKLADRPVGTLARVDDFYDTLRVDIGKVLPHVVAGVDKVAQVFDSDPLAIRVAKAVAALQPVETFPRSAENLAALLYPKLGSPSLVDAVREALRRIVNEKECGLIEDPQSGGYVFLSEGVKPLRDKRNTYVPTSGECARVRSEILRTIFDPQPSARLEGVKEVKAAVKVGRSPIVGDREDIDIRLEFVEAGSWEKRRNELLSETNTQTELKNSVVWLVRQEEQVDDLLPEVVRSEQVVSDPNLEHEADRDVAQFLRAERRLAETSREQAGKILEKSLLDGTLFFRGKPAPGAEAGKTIEAAARTVLGKAAKDVFPHFHLVPIHPRTNAAARFLGVERLDRITKEIDPLGLVSKKGGAPRVDVNHRALAEVLRAFRSKADESGSGRLQGNLLQDLFSSAPYGWSKDAVRYLFAGLLVAGEIELHTSGGVVKTSGPLAIEAMKSTMSFKRVGVSERDSKLPPEALDRAARRLEELFGDEVLPLEDHISRAVRRHLPDVQEKVGSLPDRLRLLRLPGEERSRTILANATELLKGDARGAAAVLGATECQIPEDTRWARAAVDALDTGAEAEIQQARALQQSLAELDTLCPGKGQGLLPEDEQTTFEQSLSSESFFERLPDLRAVLRGVRERATARCDEENERYLEDLRATQATLEAHPDWARLLDEDREEIAGRLRPAPIEVDADNPVRSLRTLLVRRSAIAGLLQELRAEVERRKPAEPTPVLEEPEEGEVPVEEISASTLAPSVVIRGSKDLDDWLAALRERIVGILRNKKHVRIKGDE